MQTINLKGNGQVRVGRTEIDVPYRNGITFVLPLNGSNYHEKVMKNIDLRNLLRPTTAQVLSLVDLAMKNPEEEHCTTILNKFRNNYLWTATESLSFPKGTIVYDNVDGKIPSNRKYLLNLLELEDPRVRFVEKGFETGAMTIKKAIKHPYVIAQIGEDSLEVFERVAKKINKLEVYVFGLSGTEEDEKRLSIVYGYDGGLVLDGDCHGNDRLGIASGVLN